MYFKFIFALSFKSFIFSLQRYFGMSDRFLQLNLKLLQPFGFFFVCAFFKDLECVSEANTYIFFMQCAVAAFSVYVPEFEKYDKRYGDHDE